ncbi:hypothetical protein WG8_4380 [Paenibacillus sp. Aloe-11]|nr:hypothetical protein WG8_4380 [Paenibacillus sp. Aloe-11]
MACYELSVREQLGAICLSLLGNRFGDLTGGIDPLRVGVNDDFGEHFGMEFHLGKPL